MGRPKILRFVQGWGYYSRLRDFPDGSIGIILDLGAYSGVFSQYARCLHPRARIVAVEPAPRSFAGLRVTTKEWGVECIHAAVCVRAGTEAGVVWDWHRMQNRFDTPDHLRPGEVGGGLHRGDDRVIHSATVETLTLGGLLAKVGIKDKDLGRCWLKVDIEGAERLFLEDPEAEAILTRCIGSFIECHLFPGYDLGRWQAWAADLAARETHLQVVAQPAAKGGTLVITTRRKE